MESISVDYPGKTSSMVGGGVVGFTPVIKDGFLSSQKDSNSLTSVRISIAGISFALGLTVRSVVLMKREIRGV